VSETPSPKASKRSKRKPPMEPLGWDEIVSQPGMGGYLSFLNGPVALPHLSPAAPATGLTPEVNTPREPVSMPVVEATPESDIIAVRPRSPESIPAPVLETTPGMPRKPSVVTETTPGIGRTTRRQNIPAIDQDAVVESHTAAQATPRPLAPSPQSHSSAPGVESFPVAAEARRPRIRRCLAAQDGHSLGEEVLYQALWKAAQPESTDARTITVGWRGMSQLCRMTPKNCKINTQRLLRKLALEILSPYNTPESIGTTYRVFSSEAIVRRRHEAGFEWVIRSRGVEFVNPATGVSLPMCAITC
jgi:hypothetical protein